MMGILDAVTKLGFPPSTGSNMNLLAAKWPLYFFFFFSLKLGTLSLIRSLSPCIQILASGTNMSEPSKTMSCMHTHS